MSAGLPSYLLGVASWLVAWASAFAVSAVATRWRLHGTPTGDRLLLGRDLGMAAAAYCGFCALRLPLPPAGSLRPTLDAVLGTLASALTGAYLLLVWRYGIRRVATPHTYKQRHPIVPLRILSFVLFQQLAVTFGLLDWHRLYFAAPRAVLWTALVFSLTHLGVVLYGLPLRLGIALTLASGGVMILWGSLRLAYGAPEAALLTHYLFYIGLACQDAWRNRASTDGVERPARG